MSYYIGATGEYIWDELLDNATSNVVIANHINLDAGALTEAAQQIITDSLGTAVGELIAPITEVPSATGVGVVALTALGLLSYYKLNRTAVQDVDSMVYSADYASVLTPGMFDDRVRIRYDSNQFSNAFYYAGGVKKGEILTSRINLLPVDSNNIDLYTLTGKVGIGTATPSTQLHIYHATDSILRLGTATNGKASIEFVRGAIDDVYNDFRLINQAGAFRLQYENNLLAYGDTGTNLIYASPDQISLGKKTEILGNVGINTSPPTAYALDVNGTVNATAFRGDGANITNVNATSITTGTINLDRISLTTTKLYQNFNTTNFAIIDDKIDLPPNYSFTITGYDSQTLFPPSTDRKYKGRMSCSYDDRNGVYKLLTTENKTDNIAVLQYKVGDKISIRNLANPKVDYLDYNGSKYFNSLVLYKRPSNQPLNWNNIDAYSVGMYEWRSSDGISIPEATVYTLPLGNRTYPFTTVITFIIETGFNYYLAKLYNRTNTSGGTVFVEATGYGDDFNDFNRAFGAGQTFRLQTGANFSPSDYQPKFYVPPKLEIGSVAQVGGVKPRRGLEINADTGDLDAVPLSSDLITNMNISHFTNNTGTNKIDISSSYVAPNATKLATARNIAGVSFDGSGAIDIPYANLTNKPTIPAAQVSSDWNSGSGVSMILNKPSLFSGSYSDLTNKPTIPAAQVSSDWNSGSGVSMILNKPSLFSGSYSDLTNKPTIPAAQVSSDWNSGSGVSMILNKPSLFSGSYTDLTNKPTIPAAQVSSDWNSGSGVSMILNKPTIPAAQVNSDWNAVSGLAQILNKPTLITMTDINNTSNYTTRINSQLTTAIAATQPKIISTAGQVIIGNGDGITTTSTGLTWVTNTLNATNLTTTNTITTPNLAVSTQATITQLLTSGNGTLGTDMFSLVNNATNSLRFAQVWIGANDQKWLLIQKTNNVDNTIFNFRNGNIAVGTFSNPAYRIDLVGDINITGNYRVNSTIYKPANAVLADTATTAVALATSRNIAGVAFNGTADINIDYFSLNSKPIILQPTTTNLQLVSGYTFAVPGNVSIGTTAIATNVLQVGSGARLRIANNATDYTIIGTNDTDGATNTQIIISGNTRATNTGNIQYLATASGGSHIFYTTGTSTRMTISSSGVNIPDNLGVTGRVGIGTAPHATYKLDVLGDINVSGAFRVGGVALANSWLANTVDATRIYYNLGNVGIGTTNPTNKLHIVNSSTAGNPDTGSISLNVYNPTNSAGQNSVIMNGIAGSSAGKVIYGFNVNGAYGYSIRMDANSSSLKFNNNWEGLGTNNMIINSNGYIAIGAVSGGTPVYRCHIKCNYGDVAQSLHLDAGDDTNPNKYALTLYPYVIAGGQVGWIFRTQNLSGGTNTPLELRHDGSIHFQVDRWHRGNDSENRIYFAQSSTTYIRGAGSSLGTSIVFRSPTQFDMGYFSNNLLYCYGPANLSDRRIKRDIEEINDETALNMILQVQPTTYYYRDEARNRGNGKVYGFIAQQIKEVIPDAVHTTKEIIANIYKTCLVYNKREIYHSIPQDVAIDTEVHILDKEGGEKGKRCKIKEIYDDYFVIDEDIEGDDCFVFGYMIDDLNGLDKSYIYTLNVCATQELHRRIEAQDKRIKELEEKVERLLNYISI
jgi:hypothetical protein